MKDLAFLARKIFKFFEWKIARLISYILLVVSRFPKIFLLFRIFNKFYWKICRINFQTNVFLSLSLISQLRREKTGKATRISEANAFDSCKTSFPMRISYEQPSTFHSQIHFFSFRPQISSLFHLFLAQNAIVISSYFYFSILILIFFRFFFLSFYHFFFSPCHYLSFNCIICR